MGGKAACTTLGLGGGAGATGTLALGGGAGATGTLALGGGAGATGATGNELKFGWGATEAGLTADNGAAAGKPNGVSCRGAAAGMLTLVLRVLMGRGVTGLLAAGEGVTTVLGVSAGLRLEAGTATTLP